MSVNPFEHGPQKVNDFHNASDVDSGTLAQHHTLGYDLGQAAPGTDVSRRLGKLEAPSILSATEGSTNLGATTWTRVAGLTASQGRGTDISFSSGTMTINTDGYYDVSARIYWGTINGARYLMRIVNGTNPDAGLIIATEFGDVSSGGSPAISASMNAEFFSAGTQLNMYVWCSIATVTDWKKFTVARRY